MYGFYSSVKTAFYFKLSNLIKKLIKPVKGCGYNMIKDYKGRETFLQYQNTKQNRNNTKADNQPAFVSYQWNY